MPHGCETCTVSESRQTPPPCHSACPTPLSRGHRGDGGDSPWALSCRPDGSCLASPSRETGPPPGPAAPGPRAVGAFILEQVPKRLLTAGRTGSPVPCGQGLGFRDPPSRASSTGHLRCKHSWLPNCPRITAASQRGGRRRGRSNTRAALLLLGAPLAPLGSKLGAGSLAPTPELRARVVASTAASGRADRQPSWAPRRERVRGRLDPGYPCSLPATFMPLPCPPLPVLREHLAPSCITAHPPSPAAGLAPATVRTG